MFLYTSFAVFIFSAISLVVPSGFSLGALLLVLGSPLLLRKRIKLDLNKEDVALIAVLASYFLVCAVGSWVHGGPINEYDSPIRFILAIPALLLLLAYPPKPSFFWGGLAVGAILAGLLTGWQNLFAGDMRAGGYTNPIQYGNISLLLGILCLGGLGWAFSQRRAGLWTGLLSAGAVMGMLGSLFTGSRGSWICLPFSLFILYKCHGGKFPKRYIVGSLVAIIVCSSIIYVTPRTEVKARISLATSEARDYFKNGNPDSSVGARFEMWRIGMMIFPEHPFLGWGQAGMMERKAKLIKEGAANAVIADHTHLHNEYIDALVKRGIPGLISVLALYLVPFVLFSRRVTHQNSNVRPYAIAGLLLSVCYISFDLTQAFLTHNNGVMIFNFMLIILWALLRDQEKT